MAHRHYVGRRTAAFSVLRQDLLVAEHATGVRSGVARRLEGDKATPLTPASEASKPSGGFRAFAVEDGGIYEVQGVEWQAVAVTRFVRYRAEAGFTEISEADAHALARPPIDLPALVGSESAVKWAQSIRALALTAVRAKRPDLEPQFRRRLYARWWIARREKAGDEWIAEMEAVAAALRKQSHNDEE